MHLSKIRFHLAFGVLKMKWASTVMTNYFRLRFDVIELLKDADAEELTVKVTFTDYITGKVLRKQAVIKR